MIGRVDADGNSDQGFGQGGTYYYDGQGSANSIITAVAVDALGRVLGGGADVRNSGSLAVFLRLNPNGTLDGGFGAGGVVRPASSSAGNAEPLGARGLSVLNSGRILGAGATQDSGERSVTLWALTSSGSLDNSVAPAAAS